MPGGTHGVADPSGPRSHTADRAPRWPTWLTGAEVIRPERPDAVAEALAEAAERGQVVVPVGAGIHLSEGRSPDRVDVALTTGALNRVVRYDPDDLVVSFEAGLSLADIQAVLAERNQWLPVEVPGGDDVTLGGALATGLLGPRQLGSPSLRDLLLGMSVALPDGTVAKSGGMVVKNVTGFDMGRLHVGAFGTLGVICSANFKVLPRPETGATVIGTFAPDARGRTAALDAVTGSRSPASRPVSVELVVTPENCQVAARFEGRSAAVTRQVAALSTTWLSARTLAHDESADWWRRHVAGLIPWEADRTGLRIRSRPRDVATVVERCVSRLEANREVAWSICASPGQGITRLSVTGDVLDLDRYQDAIASIDHARLVAEREPAQIAARARPSERRAIDAALRQQFDPNETINRGRFPL